MAIEPSEATTSLLPGGVAAENVIVLRYGTDCIDELTGLAQGKKLFDAVVIDAVDSGFLFPADVVMEAVRQAQSFLAVQGALVLVKADKAVAVVRESLVGLMTFHVFDALSELYDYSPLLAGYVQSCLGKETCVTGQSTDLAEQVLMSAVPVLTTLGIKMKAGLIRLPDVTLCLQQ
ncbi:MAG: hypothetical protein HY711_11130 [Candidatus Melainabacteria bacterium]|nr:hypothetical protein [Candidatus Melainabacteria bacterium]